MRYDAEDIEETLLVEPPHDKLYRSYLCAMIDFNHAEYERYNNAMSLFNAHTAPSTADWRSGGGLYFPQQGVSV